MVVDRPSSIPRHAVSSLPEPDTPEKRRDGRRVRARRGALHRAARGHPADNGGFPPEGSSTRGSARRDEPSAPAGAKFRPHAIAVHQLGRHHDDAGHRHVRLLAAGDPVHRDRRCEGQESDILRVYDDQSVGLLALHPAVQHDDVHSDQEPAALRSRSFIPNITRSIRDLTTLSNTVVQRVEAHLLN